ncbi:MAG: flagellar protein FlgN [Provencibacterium sp.]|nr:flagellar protein FlgN [Provencibacterium sp.]
MAGYAGYFEGLAEGEKDKLDALLSHDLQRMERSIAQQQAVEKKMEQLEELRESLQQAAGFGNMTGQQIIALLNGAEKNELEQAYKRLSDAVASVKFYNQKSMDVCKQNLQLIGSEVVDPAAPPTYSPTQRASEGYTGAKLFDKKI